MKHSVTTSQLSHTVEMSVDEACQLMAFLAEAVRLAVHPQVATYKEFDLEVKLPSTGQNLLGGLHIVVRP